MAVKNTTQKTLADAFVNLGGRKFGLDRINEMVDWNRIDAYFTDYYKSNRGQQAYAPLMKFKILLVQSMHNLSDPAMEEMLLRDLVFRRFVGLGISDEVPDHSTIWRFREQLEENQLFETLFQEVNNQLEEQGLIIKVGQASIIDATVIEAQRSRPKKNEKGESTQDPEAEYFTKRNAKGKRETTYGYKAHVNCDEDGFIMKATFTPANVHDSKELIHLLTGNDAAVYADKAYTSKAHDELLEKLGVKNRILKKAYRNRPLTKEEKETNRVHSDTRSIIERVFGTLKLHYGIAKSRYLGRVRNHVRFIMCAMGYNLKRAITIQKNCLTRG